LESLEFLMPARHVAPHGFLLLIVAGVVAEIVWFAVVRKRSYPWREMAISIAVFVMRMPVKGATALFVTPIAFFVYEQRVATVPIDAAWGWALLLLAEEFAYYWMHRAGHEVRWLWASHVVHHTPERLHLASALRIGATEFLSGTWLFFMPLPLLGFNPLAVGAMLSLNLFYQFWLHTELIGRLGPIEWIFNTPSHHRVHHASNAEYVDRNYGGILIIWDRLFGTFAEEKPQTKIVYGLVHPVGTSNPFKILVHEWMALIRDVACARSWSARWTYLFGPPGAVAHEEPRPAARDLDLTRPPRPRASHYGVESQGTSAGRG
jgi:sterol desaturase/sphingolipid hydroxylase (fatty acid hydroxylase superfamily)